MKLLVKAYLPKKATFLILILSVAGISSLLIHSCNKREVMLMEGISLPALKSGGADNLVNNPSFETDLSGWSGWQSSLSRVSLSDAPDGNYAVKVTRTTGTSFTIDDEPASLTSTAAGQQYWASAWIKAASTSSQGKFVTLKLREINPSGSLVKETSSPALALSSGFQQLFVAVTAAGSGNTLDIRISQTGAVSGDAFYADQFILHPAPLDNFVSNPSFESNLTGWESWQGTLSRVALAAPEGGYVVKATHNTGTSFTVDDNPASVSSTVAGQEYLASVWVQAASASSIGKTVTLRLRERNASDELVQEWVSPEVQLTNNFQQLSASAVATGNNNTLDIRISQVGASSGNALHADLFVLRLGEYTPPPSPDNLIANPSFENNLNGWTGWQSVLSRESLTGAPNGSYVAKVSHSAGTSFTINDQPANVSSTATGQEYIASAWVRAASPSSVGKSVNLKLRERNSSGELVQEWSSPGLALTNTFQQLSVSGVAVNSGDSLDVRISQGSAVSGDAFYADLFELRLGDYTPPATEYPAEERPFDPEHPVYQPIPANCPLYDYSGQIVNNIVNKYKHFAFDIGGETPPIYVGQASDPTWTLVMPNGTFSVHAPNNIQAGTGSDYPLIILDKSSDTYNGHPVEYRMWRANVNYNQRTVTCQGGGVGVYANDGRILDDIPIQQGRINRALGQAEIHGQNTGSGCSYTVGMIRPIDIQRGRIDHAVRVAIGYPHGDHNRAFWPALRTEEWGGWGNENCPMGARIFLDPSVNVHAIADIIDTRSDLDAKNKAFARMFLVALQEYGLIPLDGTKSQCDPHTCGNNIYFEADQTAGWVTLIGQKNDWGSYNHVARAIRDNLPWNMLRVAHPSVFDSYGK